MPRTKVSKSSKRNREATNREEKVREFENSLEGYQNTIDNTIQDYLAAYANEVKMLLQSTSSALLKMKMCEVFEMDLITFTDWEKQKSIVHNASLQNSTLMKSAKAINPNDEGYLTEDSSTGGSLGSAATTKAVFLNASNIRSQQLMQQSARIRTPGPLSSARARRPRRSRSACGDLVSIPGSAIKIKPQLTTTGEGHGTAGADRHSRSKMRTPMSNRTKALSADRFPRAEHVNSPPAFIRYPKPGETVLSTCGSPLVSHMVPENFAHLNIPLRSGVISMRPKMLANVQANIIEDLDPATVDQLRTLKTNIDKIVSMADKAGF